MLGWEYLFRCFYSGLRDLGQFVLSAGIVGVADCDYLDCDSLGLLVLLLLRLFSDHAYGLLLFLLAAVVGVFGCVVLGK